jgi:hypothetical protein
MRRRTSVGRLSAFPLLAALSLACGGGDGGGGDGGEGGQREASRLEFFQASLHAIDPRDPSVPITIDAAAAEMEEGVNEVGALSAIGGRVSGPLLADAVVAYVVYPRRDGTLQRVSTDASQGLPIPERVSSHAQVLPLCASVVGYDFQSVGATRFAYGSDGGDCSRSLAWWVVSLFDTATTPARSFPGRPITALVHPLTGAHTGWLALEGGVLRRLAADLSVQGGDLIGGVGAGESLGVTKDGVVFLALDQGLHAFDPRTHTLTDFDFTFTAPCPCAASFASDPELGFFVDDGELFRADPHTGLVVSIDAPADARPSFENHYPTFVLAGTTRVAWSYFADQDGNPGSILDQTITIRSLERDGSNARVLDEIDPYTAQLIEMVPFSPVTSGDWLFYNKVEYDRATLEDVRATSVTVKLDDIPRWEIFVGGFWVGSSIRPRVAAPLAGPAEHLIRLEDMPDLRDLGVPHLSVVKGVDARDPTAPVVWLNHLSGPAHFALAAPGLGPARVGAAYTPDGRGGYQTDIVYWVDGKKNSLRVLPETESVSEIPAPQF